MIGTPCPGCGDPLDVSDAPLLCSSCRATLAAEGAQDSPRSRSLTEDGVMKRSGRARPSEVPWATLGLIVINLAIFGALWSTGSARDTVALLRWGAKSNDLIWQGQWWRFLTPIFLHLGLFHLVCNAVVLLFFGRILESMTGATRYIGIYLISGLSGVIAGFCFHDNLSAGSSGAILGVIGGLAATLTLNREAFPGLRTRDVVSMGLLVAAFLGFGAVQPRVDNWAHVGGLGGGFLGGLVLVKRLPRVVPRPHVRLTAGLIWVVAVTFGLVRGFGWIEHIRAGQEAYRLRDLTKAREAFVKASTLRPRPTTALYAIAEIDRQQRRLEDARSTLEKAIAMDPSSADGWIHLAQVYRDMARHGEALRSLEKAKELEKDRIEISFRLGQAYLETGNAKAALPHLQEAYERDATPDPLLECLLGDAFRRTGQVERGMGHLKTYEHRLRQHVSDRGTPVSLNNLAWFLFEEGRSLADAEGFARRAVQLDPTNQYYLGTLGCLLVARKDAAGGLATLERALQNHISRADASTDLYFAAQACAQLGRRAKALEYMQDATTLDPTNKFRAQTARMLEVRPAPATSPGPTPSPR